MSRSTISCMICPFTIQKSDCISKETVAVNAPFSFFPLSSRLLEQKTRQKRRKGKVVTFKERLLFSLHWVSLFFLPSTAEQRPPLVSQWVPVSRRWLFKRFVHKSRQFGASWFSQRLNNNYRLCNSFLCQGSQCFVWLRSNNVWRHRIKPLITFLWNSLN